MPPVHEAGFDGGNSVVNKPNRQRDGPGGPKPFLTGESDRIWSAVTDQFILDRRIPDRLDWIEGWLFFRD